MFFLCPHSSHVYVCAILFFVHTITCFLGPQNFAPFLFFPICKGGNVVVEAKSPKLFQVQASNGHLCLMSMLFLCPSSFHVYVCSLVFLCTPLHFFGPLDFCSPFVLSFLQGWEHDGCNKIAITQKNSSSNFK
jgi:hypothetical protein